MKQPNGKKNHRKTREETAFLYSRLSRDDNLDGESYSIQNQKKLLAKVAKEKGYVNFEHFEDDGISGVTMNRPGFNRMMAALDEGRASAVFVKDMSRLGRNYIEVGRLTEEYFPDNNIRLVAVSDNVDTDEGDNDLTPIRNLFNEWYARDISKKRRISNKIKGMSGEPLGQPPYGYKKDPADAKHWLVDEEAAAVVRRIFQMALNGYGVEQTADRLTQDLILTPMYYWKGKGVNRPGKMVERPPHHWNSTTIINILSSQEYCGDIINFKTYTKSYKNKKQLKNDPEDWVVFRDVNRAIVDRTSFELVQQKRGKVRKIKPKDAEPSIFSGLLVCADCGHNLWYHFNQGNTDIKYFNWAGFAKGILNVGIIYYPVAVVEFLVFAPMVGVGGSYLSFLTGNLSNLKIPCAINSRDIAKVESGTPEAEVVSTISIATSALVTMLILFVGVMLIVPLTPVLEMPVLKPAFDNVVAALFGALGLKYFAKEPKIAVIPLVVLTALCIFVPGMISQTSILIIPAGLIALGIGYYLFKKDKLSH